jgi:hypothetical protein
LSQLAREYPEAASRWYVKAYNRDTTPPILGVLNVQIANDLHLKAIGVPEGLLSETLICHRLAPTLLCYGEFPKTGHRAGHSWFLNLS